MAKQSFNLAAGLGRIVKGAMVALVIPLAVGLVSGLLAQLELVPLSSATFRAWVQWGFLAYVGLHTLLCRPVPLFRISHRLFAALAVWLFGGHVTSVEGAGGGSKGKGGTKGSAGAGTAAEGSTLVAFSPYVIPVYTVLVCVIAWVLRRWWSPVFVDGPAAFFIGVTMAFHWLMTAEDLQQQRQRWHIETYLLALGLVFVLTVLIGSACLPLAVPDFSYVQMLSDGMMRTQAIYVAIIQQLFF